MRESAIQQFNHDSTVHQSSSSNRSMSRSRSRTPNSQRTQRLEEMGFEDGELEMFFETTDFTDDQLVEKYLEIARNPPYNLNWDEETARSPNNYMIGVYKRNGVEYTKHDIAEDVFTYFYFDAEGRGEGVNKKKRGTRKSGKKHRSHKRKNSRRHRTRHRRRHN